MRETRLIMGMPITIEVADGAPAIAAAFAYFESVDARFSPFKPDSEVAALNRMGAEAAPLSDDMREILALAETTRAETDGYFDICRPGGTIDPSGIVKGWAIRNAARLIAGMGHGNFYVEAGGDVQCAGRNADGRPWRIGIRNPFDEAGVIKALQPGDAGVATSGSYVRGAHIYDPHDPGATLAEVVSLTVIADDICDADRFATAAFAMGRHGIHFVEAMTGLEGYAVDHSGTATMTSGFKRLVAP